ncbi:BZ3500_MvSof-1268-A1-R1_Chr10-2g02891 [Microbotryum saponariae]|uniref:BZ3500_MvSof-1268-A1-R1_Chr10-2g02891 protein n=1 Tax=Microbotryum saponariae TaxID=289078 RepID=A0A2X0L7Q9_9BASI|nr:BZ3501_MvSof-1269-A2-R1_Chr10-2g02477 [Microbotryum saponariae]SDA01689.1 BZ3500_MvSof-1268-A1-R1_Chr10-2g02891 [Microbotryum saponariae]
MTLRFPKQTATTFATANRSTQRRANWFFKSICTGSTSAFSIFLPPALHTLPIAPHSIATSSSRHPKRSSWKLCNEYGIKKSGDTACVSYPLTWLGRIDFVRLRIRVIGTLNKTASGRVNCGSPSRGRSSTARFGGVTVMLAGNPKQCLPVIPRLGDHAGQPVLLPRITLKTGSSTGLPFTLHRTQFPIRLAMAMTFSKLQEQSLAQVGVCLETPVFCHGQLYVALS